MSMYVLMLAGAALLGGLTAFIAGESIYGAVLAIFVAGLVGSKLAYANRLPRGHGVRANSRHILGMPPILFVGYVLILGGVVYLGRFRDFSPFFGVLSLCFFYGWAAGILDWYVFSRVETYYFSAVAISKDMLKKGRSIEEVLDRIEAFRRAGLLAPEK
jgi:hypothetical protein